MKCVKAVDKGVTEEMYGKAENKGLVPNRRGKRRGCCEGEAFWVPPPAAQMVVKRSELRARSLEVWQGRELQADDFGQKPAKRGVALDVWQGKDLA